MLPPIAAAVVSVACRRMTVSERADVVVVGLGAMGSAVCAQLATRGASVIGIDRYDPPHRYGSTHGETRMTRVAVGEGSEYVPLVRRSHELWR
jgi:sarcosine oxidase